MDLLSLALGGAGSVLLTVLALVVRQVLAKILSSGGHGAGTAGIVITNTGSSAAAEADASGQHSIPPPRRALPSLAGIDQETTPTDWVAPARCEQLRAQLERKMDERAEKSGGRLEGKMDGMVVEQRRMNDTLIRLTTLQEEAAKREEGFGKRLERLESGARMPAGGRR